MVRHLNSHPPKTVTLSGPAGQLVATLEVPKASPLGVVLHLHPHPQHGGTRRNNVVRYGALGSLEAGCVALRLDFRSVGDSEGCHDEGFGEMEDAAAALEWLQAEYPDLPLFIWGFSFGSRVGLNLLLEKSFPIQGYMGVAWPNAFYEWPAHSTIPKNTAFLVGSADEYVDLSRNEIPNPTILEGAGHFFENHLPNVSAFTKDSLQQFGIISA